MQIMKKRVLSLLLALCLVLGALPLSAMATEAPDAPQAPVTDTVDTPPVAPEGEEQNQTPPVEDEETSTKEEATSDEEKASDEEKPADQEEAPADAEEDVALQTVDGEAAPLAEEETACLTVLESASAQATTRVGSLYQLKLADVFQDAEGHSLTYSFTSSVSNDKIKIKDGVFYFSIPKTGSYEVTLKATCTDASASHKLTIDVEPAAEGIAAQYGYNETAASAVTVYVTVSNDGMPLMDENGTVLSHLKVTVPYFDLSSYGLEDFYRLSTDGGKGPYTGENVIQRPTGLHLYIYLLERYYMGLPAEKCGKGTSGVLDCSDNKGVLYMDATPAYDSEGKKALQITGSATSLYMVNFWGHDENLMYFRNHCYPYMSAGWGATSDYILLSDGDTWDVAMFSNWDFYHTGYFARFDQDAYTVETGKSLTVSTRKWGTTSDSTDFSDINGLNVGLYNSSWEKVQTLSYTSGNSLTFTAPAEAGEYYLLAMDPNATDSVDAKGAPATARVTVKPVAVTGVTLDQTELLLAPEATAKLTATVTPEDAVEKTVTWTSDKEEVATVSEDGTVTAVAKGTATITAKAGEITATCTVTVNQKPVLKEGVSATKEDVCLVGYAYNLPELQNNTVFEDPDGDTLNYTSYYYQRSTDGGKTWSEKANFEPSLFGFTTIQFTETTPGTYIYRFQAWDGYAYSDDTYTLTLHVSETVTEPYAFYVSKDYTGGYPQLRIYEAAGVDADGHDYVGWYKKGEETVYIYDPLAHKLEENATGWTADGYTLHDFAPVTLTDSLFGAEATEENPATESGTVVSNYAMFYANLANGKYSLRLYAKNSETGEYDVYVGGQQMILPTEINVDGGTGGGRAIYLRQVSIYTNTKKDDGTYFSAEDYDASINMNIMQCKPQHGGAYIKSGQTYYPFYIYAAGNAATFTIVVTPKVEGYAVSQQINCTQPAGTSAVARNISLKKSLTLTVTAPAQGDFGLYFQWNNFNTTEVEPESREVNGDTQTLVYKFSASNSNYTWRLSDSNGTYVTKAGWLSSSNKDMEMTVSFDRTDRKSHSFAGLGTTVALRDEADIQVFLNPQGFMSTSGTYRVRSFRMWELINSDTANIMVEPDTHIQVLQGNAGDIRQVTGGNAGGNWLDVTPTTTDIVAVHYDAIDMDTSNNTTHAGFFPATNPERTGVFIMTNAAAGKADAHVVYNRNPSATSRSDEWDYNYDTWFYMDTDKEPTLDFTVYKTSGDVSVSYATVTTSSSMVSSLSGWQSLSADSEGRYFVDLRAFRNAGTKGGTVIIRMTDGSGTSYRLVRVAESSVTVSNVSAPGEPVMPGDTVTLTFDGLYRSVNKIAGVFNPTTYKLRYTSGEKEVDGTLGQYQQMDRSSITLTVPEDVELDENGKGTYAFSNGYVFGSMYSAANPFSMMYNMTDTGVGTNFNAVTVNFCLHRLADVVIEVEEKVTLDLKVAPMDGATAVEGATITLKDRTGKAMTANDEGIFKGLSYGDYTYEIAKAGYLCNVGAIHLGTEDKNAAVEGQVTKTIALTKGSENGWDGTSVAEPAKNEADVYQIGNAAELAWFAKAVNGGQTGISAVLTADIDLAQYNWTPIGNNSKKFAGTFDGKNHTIRNLAIRGSGNYQGLFGYVNGTSSDPAEVRNLKVEGTMTLGNASYAGTIGSAMYATIRNVHADVDISGTKVDTVGGVVGNASRETLIENCSNAGDITGYQYVGGVLGNGSIKTVTVTGCVNTGHITGTYWKIGGIVGQDAGPVTACYNTGRVDGVSGTGGVVGYASGATAEVTSCFNLGTVTGNKEFGAVVGQFNNASAPAANLYYLEGSCETGIGKLATGGKQTAQTVSSATLAGRDLVVALNESLDAAAFGMGTAHPLLLWQGGAVAVNPDDLNCDNIINMEDVSTLLKAVNTGESLLVDGDLNGDGILNMEDVSLLLQKVNVSAEAAE